MMRTFVREVLQSFGPYLERGRCLIITPDEAPKNFLQQVFQTALGRRGVLPEITTASEWAWRLHEQKQTEAARLFLRFLQNIRAGTPQPPWSVALQQAWFLLRTVRFCRQDGGTTTLPPLPLASLPPSGDFLWSLLQSVDTDCPQSDGAEESLVEAFVQSHPEEAFVFLDVFSSRERPFLQAVRNVFAQHTNTLVWNPQASSPRQTPLFVGEFRSYRSEAGFIVEDIQKRWIHCPSEKVAVVTDDQLLRQYLLAEGLRRGLSFRVRSARVGWADTPAGLCIEALAEWLSDDSVRSWSQWGGALMGLAHLPENQRRFWHFFLANVVRSPGISVDGRFTVPAFALPKDLRFFVEKRFESFLEGRMEFEKTSNWRQERAWRGEKPLNCWVRQHLQDCKGWEELSGVTLPTQALLNLEDVLLLEDDGEPICARDYVQILSELLRVLTKEVPRLALTSDPSPEPWLLSVRESAFMACDTVYLAGLNETWVQMEEPPPFFHKGRNLHLIDLEVIFQQHLSRRTVTVTRTVEARAKPHVFWRVLSDLPPALRVDVSAARSEPLQNYEKAGSPSVRASVPFSLRPRRFSITDWQLLQDDSYAYYAKTLLKLIPTSLKISISQNLGLWAHDLLYRYFSRRGRTITLADFAEQRCSQEVSGPSKMFWQRLKPVFMEMSDAWERDRQTLLEVQSEVCKERQVVVRDQLFSFFGVCDRIDRFPDRVRVVDFKTGRIPREKELRELGLWQLPLEASMIRAENPVSTVEISLISLRSTWGKERDFTLLFDEELSERVEKSLEACLEVYCGEDFAFETMAESPTRAIRYAALERLTESLT